MGEAVSATTSLRSDLVPHVVFAHQLGHMGRRIPGGSVVDDEAPSISQTLASVAAVARELDVGERLCQLSRTSATGSRVRLSMMVSRSLASCSSSSRSGMGVFSLAAHEEAGAERRMVRRFFQLRIVRHANYHEFGLASTVPRHAKMQAGAAYRRWAGQRSCGASRFTTWALAASDLPAWGRVAPARGGSPGRRRYSAAPDSGVRRTRNGRLGDRLAHLVVVHQAVVDGCDITVVGDLPGSGCLRALRRSCSWARRRRRQAARRTRLAVKRPRRS